VPVADKQEVNYIISWNRFFAPNSASHTGGWNGS